MFRHKLNGICWFLFRQVSHQTHLDLTFFESIMKSLEAQYEHCYFAFLQYFWFGSGSDFSFNLPHSSNVDILSHIPLEPSITRSIYFHLQVRISLAFCLKF